MTHWVKDISQEFMKRSAHGEGVITRSLYSTVKDNGYQGVLGTKVSAYRYGHCTRFGINAIEVPQKLVEALREKIIIILR